MGSDPISLDPISLEAPVLVFGRNTASPIAPYIAASSPFSARSINLRVFSTP